MRIAKKRRCAAFETLVAIKRVCNGIVPDAGSFCCAFEERRDFA
ncbi:hypothetical protein NBRC111894_3624 [Sporolactobacillus inulinus]|uniref:Uncharacterized protein n=1 Tax=Sporolactobacillus inulinus TaxID=2078 RepID=A0A4Y1ZGI8_9BACL|nr:hypothetical protein NBRC111894_3624 [Sporolactobacillus inulinus]